MQLAAHGLLGAEISVKQNALTRGGGQHRGHARRVSRPGVEEQLCTGSSSMPAGLGQGLGVGVGTTSTSKQ